MHTALGNIDIPDYIKTFPHDEAFGKVLKQMILRALQDMQKNGELVILDPVDLEYFKKQIGLLSMPGRKAMTS